MRTHINLVTLFMALMFLQGCVAVQSFPTAARAGDTVSLAVGSAEGMTKTNTTLTYTPDGTGTPISIPATNIRAIVPIYPDKRSPAWSNSDAKGVATLTGHGSWLMVLVVDLPAGLPVGTGNLNVQTAATLPPTTTHVNDVNIALEILLGTGTPSTFSYMNGVETAGDLSLLEAAPHYLIKPGYEGLPSPWPTYGAIEIKVTGTITGATEAGIDGSMRVVPDEMEQNLVSHMQMDWARTGDTTTITLISSVGRLNYYEARASIFFKNAAINYVSAPTITARYFDINGVEVIGPLIATAFVTN